VYITAQTPAPQAVTIVIAMTTITPSPTCPLCHTVDTTITNAALAAGGTWRCTRCGQMWSADRLATAAAYARSQAGTATDLM
jgi:transposase-like protein